MTYRGVNALAETVIGLFKTEVIRQQGPWKSLEDIEFATLAWVGWFNNKRLLVPIGDMPPDRSPGSEPPLDYLGARFERQIECAPLYLGQGWCL